MTTVSLIGPLRLFGTSDLKGTVLWQMLLTLYAISALVALFAIAIVPRPRPAGLPAMDLRTPERQS